MVEKENAESSEVAAASSAGDDNAAKNAEVSKEQSPEAGLVQENPNADDDMDKLEDSVAKVPKIAKQQDPDPLKDDKADPVDKGCEGSQARVSALKMRRVSFDIPEGGPATAIAAPPPVAKQEDGDGSDDGIFDFSASEVAQHFVVSRPPLGPPAVIAPEAPRLHL